VRHDDPPERALREGSKLLLADKDCVRHKARSLKNADPWFLGISSGTLYDCIVMNNER